MIIPIIFFALKRSFAGIMAAILALFTSMFWFPEPLETSKNVQTFLAYELAYLNSDWTLLKIFFSLSAIVFFCLVIAAAWFRNWKWLIGVLIGVAGLKILWSVLASGPSGFSIVLPAILGLILCIGAVYYFYKRSKN